MNRTLHAFGLALLLVAASTTFDAVTSSARPDDGEIHVGDLAIAEAWSRATPKGAPTGAAYLTITNRGASPDRLISVSSPVAEATEIHEMSMTDGVMKMRRLEEGLEIPAGETVKFEPGGYHVMFTKLGGQIEEGATVSLTLTFEHAGEVTIETVAAPIGAREPPMDHGSHSTHTN